MSTPLVREAGVLAALPDAIEAYIRPLAGPHQLRAVSMGGFLLAGAIAGELVFAAQTDRRSGGCRSGFFIAGLAGIALAYALSFQPSIYPVANFWTSSPTFFFIRLGFCTALVPIARGIDHFHAFAAAPVEQIFSAPRRARPRHRHARPLVAVRVLDSRRDGVRRPSPGRSSARCRSSCRSRHASRSARCSTRSCCGRTGRCGTCELTGRGESWRRS